MATVLKRNGSYRIKVSCGYDIHGNQKSQYKTWRPPENMTERQIKKELERQVVLFEEECEKGQITASIKFEALAEEWFENYAKLNLKKSSYTRQRTLTQRVYPAIGHLKLDKITSRDIQKFINDLAVNGKNLQTGKPISRKTVIHHLSFISSVFAYAIKMDMIKDNPCTRATVPKGAKKEKAIYTIEEVQHLCELLETAPLVYRTFIILAVYSGFRRGEICGLEWSDIDWEHNVIGIRRTANYSPLYGSYTDTRRDAPSVRPSSHLW
jgi:integrase